MGTEATSVPVKPLTQFYAGDERTTLNIPERQVSSRESTQQDNLDEANIGQLSPSEKEADRIRCYNRFIYVGVDISIYVLLTGGWI